MKEAGTNEIPMVSTDLSDDTKKYIEVMKGGEKWWKEKVKELGIPKRFLKKK